MGLASSDTAIAGAPDLDEAPGASLHAHAGWRAFLTSDRGALSALLGLLGLLTILAWHRWALPTTDPGLDLTTADLIAHGGMPYRDINFFYGPAGVYALAFWFKLFGVSLASAVAFGYLQACAILATAYALARVWLAPMIAALTVAWVACASFTGSLANLVLPHSNSATVGILFVLLECLAVARRRPWLAGVAAAGACLTRPEYVLAAAALGLGAMLGAARDSGDWRTGVREGLRIAMPTVVLAGAVWAFFAAKIGTHALIYENLFPSSFVKVASKVQAGQAPFDLASLVNTLGRVLVYGSLAGTFVLSWIRLRGVSGVRGRLAAVWPLAAAIVGLAALDGFLRLTSIAHTSQRTVEHEVTHLLMGMSWLPILSIVAAAWALLRARRPGPAPLGGSSWAGDLALLFMAGALSLRAYNQFTPANYAPYYVAGPMLIAVIAHEALGRYRRAALVPLRVCIGICALSLVAHGYLSVLRPNTTAVHAARGTFLEPRRAAAALQDTLDFLRGHANRSWSCPTTPGFTSWPISRPRFTSRRSSPAFSTPPRSAERSPS
jgi:hypothetical protein